ncbi:MAG: recombinase family protein [Chloroflexi bacterium]|nr:recombinase family protein [Chloroflexota bacterium]
MNTTLTTKRAVGYLRVSTPGQTGNNHSSLETQESRYKEYCQRNDLLPLCHFVDIVSGRRDDRKEYRRMVEYAIQGNTDVIVVQYLDRFGRNPREILQRYWELQDAGVSVVATDEDINEELILLIKAGIAGAESRRTSERVRANMSRAVEKGVHAARAPFGLRRIYHGKEVSWEKDPVEASAVKEMYRLSVEENRGYKAIADLLNEAGHHARSGRPFSSFTIQRVLSNEAMMGDLTYGKKPKKGNPQQELVRVKAFFPAIFNETEWTTLQKRLEIRRESSRGRAHSSEYLLSGIARCGYCGGPMTGKAAASYKGRQYRNYWCSRATRSRALCEHYNGHSTTKLESAVLEYLSQFSDPEIVKQHIESADQAELTARETELKDIELALADLDSQFTQNLGFMRRGVLNEQEFVKANNLAREQVSALQAQKGSLAEWVDEQKEREQTTERVPGMVKTFIEDFQAMEPRVRKSHLQTILKSAHVRRNSIELEFRT